MRNRTLLYVAMAGALIATMAPVACLAARIDINTTKDNIGKWQVSEISHGKITAPAVYAGSTYGGVDAITFPFTDNDGFWTATLKFTLPANYTGASLHISAVGVDDRAVVKLNGKDITDVGTLNNGAGFMTYHDHGPNKPRNFKYIAGPQNIIFKKRFVAGENEIKIVVNNTGNGIYGGLQPNGGPTNVGIVGYVKYHAPKS